MRLRRWRWLGPLILDRFIREPGADGGGYETEDTDHYTDDLARVESIITTTSSIFVVAVVAVVVIAAAAAR